MDIRIRTKMSRIPNTGYIRYVLICLPQGQLLIDQSFFLFRDEEDLFDDMEMTETLVKDEEDLIAQVLKVKKEC